MGLGSLKYSKNSWYERSMATQRSAGTGRASGYIWDIVDMPYRGWNRSWKNELKWNIFTRVLQVRIKSSKKYEYKKKRKKKEKMYWNDSYSI